MTRPYDDETLMRRIDGECAADERAAIDAAAAADPVLAARLERLRAPGRLAREAFPAAVDPRDMDLARLIASHPAPVPVGERLKAWLGTALAPRQAALWGGLATAAFVAGIVVAPLLGSPTTGGDGFTVGADGRIADAAVVRVLDRRLAAEGPDAAGRAVGLTFRDADGRWCRTFTAGEAGVAGLACRGETGWGLVALSPFEAAGSEVRTAAADTPQVVLDAVDARLSGETADAAAEAGARDAGWR